jgi:hypothetical protein
MLEFESGPTRDRRIPNPIPTPIMTARDHPAAGASDPIRSRLLRHDELSADVDADGSDVVHNPRAGTRRNRH